MVLIAYRATMRDSPNDHLGAFCLLFELLSRQPAKTMKLKVQNRLQKTGCADGEHDKPKRHRQPDGKGGMRFCATAGDAGHT
jgi:hypothetical protein